MVEDALRIDVEPERVVWDLMCYSEELNEEISIIK